MKKEDVYARMMHTPDDPERAAQRAALRDAWKHLLPLHRALIDSAKADFSARFGAPDGPHHLMRLLQEDPFFGWLKPLTSLIVDLDELSRTDFGRNEIDAMIARIEAMFGAEPDADFAARYVPLIQRDVDVAIAHAAIRQAVVKLSAK